MRIQPIVKIGTLSAVSVWASLVSAFELTSAETSASWVAPEEPVAPYLNLNFNAELGSLASIESDVVISWEEVGGIEPTPFQVIIPAGCFVSDGRSLSVRNHRRCGVMALLTDQSGVEYSLPISTFSAALTPIREYGRLSFSASLYPTTTEGDVTAVLLGIIGGAQQTVMIAGESSSLLPNDLSIRGFNPQPEPPAVGF